MNTHGSYHLDSLHPSIALGPSVGQAGGCDGSGCCQQQGCCRSGSHHKRVEREVSASVQEPEISRDCACRLRGAKGVSQCHRNSNPAPPALHIAWSRSVAAAQSQTDVMVLPRGALLVGHNAVSLLTGPAAGKDNA